MNRIYTINGCAVCKRVKRYFKEHEIPCKEINLYNTLLEPEAASQLWELLNELAPDYIQRLHRFDPEADGRTFGQYPSLIPKPFLVCEPETARQLQPIMRNACKADCAAFTTCARAAAYWNEDHPS